MTAPHARPDSPTPPDEPLDTIWFDCDSTLSAIEGIDELALRAGPEVAERVQRLTDAAMDGETTLETVYAARLEAIRPDRTACDAIGLRYIARALGDAREVCAALRSLDKRLGIVSGGLSPCVLVLADHLGIDADRVHAVDVHFDSRGNYKGFDDRSPLARSGGKPELLARLQRATDQRAAFVGDGATDLETASCVERFVGFGGVVRREAVAAGARHWAPGPGLATVLPHVLTADEQRRLGAVERFAELLHPPGTAQP